MTSVIQEYPEGNFIREAKGRMQCAPTSCRRGRFLLPKSWGMAHNYVPLQVERKSDSFEKLSLCRFLVETGESRTPRPEERYSESLQAYTAVCSRSTVIRRPISVEPADVS